MKPFESSILIAAPIESVFAMCADFANAPQNVPAILRVEMLTEGPARVGTKFRETRKMFGKEATVEMTVSSIIPNEEITLVAAEGGCEYTSQFRFERAGADTRLTRLCGTKPLTVVAKVMGVLMVFMKGMMTKMIRKDLESIKARAEAKP